MAGAGGEWGVVHGYDDAAVELGDDAGSGFAGGSAVEYGTADRESAGGSGAGGEAGTECLGWRWVDSGFGDYVDDAIEDAGAGDYAGGLVIGFQFSVVSVIFSAHMNKTGFAGVLVVAAVCSMGMAQKPPSAVESAMVKAVDGETPAAIGLLEKLVNINSGTMNLAGVVAVKDVVAPQIEALGFKVQWTPMESLDGRAGDLVAEHVCGAGAGKCGKRILLIGHLDTVFEPSSSFQRYSIVPGTNGNVATGPGVNDMKGGLVVMLTALQAMKTAGVLDNAEIRIVLSGDEEKHGFPVSVSRKDMIDAAKKSDVALEFEPGGMVNGKDVQSISRRSAASWRVEASASRWGARSSWKKSRTTAFT